ncbi:MAG TPA: exosortase/archaeosortase family protein [Verrucomicrobiae bacterium]|nr:exosortase/archaeosortase family protein [Verrucomicrobiae bacterium]
MSDGLTIAKSRFSFNSINWVKVALLLVLAGLIYYSYWVQPVERAMTCYEWLTRHWSNVSNYSHGPLIPLIAGLLVWWKRKELLAARIAPARLGTAVVAIASGFYYMGVKADQPRIVVFSFVILLYGLALALGGREVFRVLFFPITFLLLMIPLNFLDEVVGFPLRQMVASMSTALLNWFGIETVRVGTAIYSRVFHFDVADPCSGIRSLMALTTVTAAYAYVTQRVQWKRWVLFLSAVPLAVLGNLARVSSIALVAEVYGQELATKTYHEYSGYIVFGVALSAMVVIGLLLNFPYRRVFESLMKPAPNREDVDGDRLPPPDQPERFHE